MKHQTHISRKDRKQQIIRETMFLSEINVLPTMELICNQTGLALSTHTRELLTELGYKDGLLQIIEAKNRHTHKLLYYYPLQDEIIAAYGIDWYTNVMKGIERRIRKLDT